MSQPPNTVLNGPSPENNVPLKDAQASHERINVQQQNGSGFQQPLPFPPGAARPPLTRIDSRSTLPIRPGFPNQPGAVLRPQQIRQPTPGQQHFIQRPPGLGPRPPGQPPFVQNQGARPIVNPNYRPATPFPRPPGPQGPPGHLPSQGQRQPGIFQQRSVPSFGQQRPHFDGEHPLRSQTLDSTDISFNKPPENVRSSQEDISRPAINAMKNRSLSMSSNVSDSQNLTEDERRRSISSLDGRRSASGSVENLDKKSEGDSPSRPESRASSRMNKIVEDDDGDKSNNFSKLPSLQAELQKSVDFKLPNNDVKIKPPSPAAQEQVKKEEIIMPNKEIREDIKNVQKVIQNENIIEKKAEMKGLDLKHVSKSKSPSRTEGDNDSGVDESTQGNDQSSNGDHSSPRKSSGKTTSRTSSVTPTKNRSLSRGSKSPSLKSPDSTASTPGTTEKKKLPMNKIQVGSAPSPNLKVVRSKIGSLDNASYKPGGGKVKIESKKVEFKNAAPRIAAKNETYTPKGGEKKIQQQKLQWNAKSKIGSLENANHKPKGGEKKIESVKLDFKDKAKSKVGSKDNIKHVPGGGDIKIETKKLDLKVQSKIGSLDNVKHKPGGGDKKIFDDKDYLKQRSALTSENHSLSGSQNSLPSQPEAGGPLADVNLNEER